MKHGVILVSGLLASALLLAGCGKKTEPAADAPAAAQAVVSTRLQTANWPQQIASNGMIYPQSVVNVSAEVGGLRVAELLADVGQQVRKGQLLARLATDTLQVDLARQRGLLAQAEAQLAQAQANAKRTRALAASGAMSDEAILQYQVAEETARAQLQIAKADIAATELKIKQSEIRAWEAGVIAGRPVELGEVVNIGSPLFEIYQDGILEWRAEVTARQAAQIKLGQRAQLQLAHGEQLTAEIVKIDTALDQNTGRLTLYARLPASERVRAGMFASGHILLGEAPAVAIVESALLLRDGRTYLLEVGSDNKVLRRTVETGRRQASMVEIVTELPRDAQFVAEGVAFLSEGTLVKVVQQMPEPTAQPAPESAP